MAWRAIGRASLALSFAGFFAAPVVAGGDFPLGEVAVVTGTEIDDPGGVESYIGVRIQSAGDMPISDLGLAQTTGGLRFVIQLPALPAQSQLMIEHASAMSYEAPALLFPFSGFVAGPPLPSFDVQSAIDSGDASELVTAMLQQCALEAFDDFPVAPGGAEGGVAGNPCPDDNCTEYLKPWLEDIVAAFRKRGLWRMADLMQELIDKERIVVDVGNVYRDMAGVPPGECAGVYYNPFIGKKYFFISPVCLDESTKGRMAGLVMSGAMLGIDSELRKWNLDDTADRMAFELLQISIILDWADNNPEKTEKFFEMLKKVMEAAGLRPLATMFECLELARMYHISEDEELLNKLRQCVRRMIAETLALVALPPAQQQQLLEHIKARLDRLTELLEAKDWETIEEEFGITRDCLDPTFVNSMACPEDPEVQPECGSVDAGPCFEPHETGACSDALLCADVCEQDPFCCEQMWDEWCVDMAEMLAGEVCAQGSCCDPGGGPGCDDPLCCQTVCDVLPHCCADAWDEACVKVAGEMCPHVCSDAPLACAGASGDCFGPHDGVGCEDANCCATVCMIDPLCCNKVWDAMCAAQAVFTCDIPLACGAPETDDCCAAHETASCQDPSCCEAVCASDSFCCGVAWDELCVQAAQGQDECGCAAEPVCGDPLLGDCFEAHADAGCVDGACCESVCALDPHCCEFEWDSICAAEAENFCTACPQDCVSSETFQPPPDGQVDGADLAVLLGDWGPCEGCCTDTVSRATFMPPADNMVDGADLAVLLGAWGEPGCPQ